VPVVKIVPVALVLQGRMSTVRTMHMRVPFVSCMTGAHMVLLNYVEANPGPFATISRAQLGKFRDSGQTDIRVI